jgi:hypothetical protein
MKYTILLKIDWLAQTAGIIVVIMLMIIGRTTNSWNAAFIVLIWQFFSALTGVILTKGRDSSRALFLFLFVMFITTFYPILGILTTFGAAVPCALMIHYWIITTKALRRFRNHDGSFLRHISF